MMSEKFIIQRNIRIGEIKRIQTEIKKESQKKYEKFLYAEMCKNK